MFAAKCCLLLLTPGIEKGYRVFTYKPADTARKFLEQWRFHDGVR
jgi:hypothetical protein